MLDLLDAAGCEGPEACLTGVGDLPSCIIPRLDEAEEALRSREPKRARPPPTLAEGDLD